MTSIQAKRRLSLIAVIAVAVMIFVFSAQEGEESAKLSAGVTDWVLRMVVPGYGEMTVSEKLHYLNIAGFWVRKAAHFSEYALLAFTLSVHLHYVLIGQRFRRVALCAWGVATLYACTDELHQMFVSARGPAVRDVLIDSAGALTGAFLGIILIILWHRAKNKRHSLV